MKFQFKTIIAALAITFAFTSCSNDDDDATNTITGEGAIGLEFDNVFGSANLILNTQINTTSQGENLKVSDVKYIVSNIVLTKEDGSTYTVPKSESYFIVDESDEASQTIELSNVPAGNYTKVKFGIGVDQEQFNLGADGQGDFLTLADSKGMMWSWSAGYKFVKFEGLFTSASVATDTEFMVHTGQTGTDYNYTEITLNLPEQATVRTTITPDVHIFADVAKIIDGTNKINLSDNNMGGMGAMIMGGANLPLITANLSGMFTVNHVHND
ncbi:MAG: hypothetical protein IPP30_11025 [Flavobacterium sp.]|nr:hypothetical protein [Flavobacterium sp.]